MRISALAAAAVLLFAAPDLAHAQQPGRRGQQHEQPDARPAEPAPRQTAEPRNEPRRESPPPRATREEPRQATPAKPAEPRSTGEPELKRRKPDLGRGGHGMLRNQGQYAVQEAAAGSLLLATRRSVPS